MNDRQKTLRNAPLPAILAPHAHQAADEGLASNHPCQLSAVKKALGPNNPRTSILLADAVGRGKTIEISGEQRVLVP